MSNLELLDKIEDIRNLKRAMKGCSSWTSPQTSFAKENYELSTSVKPEYVGSIQVFARTSCGPEHIYFEATSLINLKRAEMILRFGHLLKMVKATAEDIFNILDNPANYKFDKVWRTLKTIKRTQWKS